jgi:hypothetical protein
MGRHHIRHARVRKRKARVMNLRNTSLSRIVNSDKEIFLATFAQRRIEEIELNPRRRGWEDSVAAR